jgi:2-keto-4-pentenoate hydratase/2-oxohepta-3-ene-1,7-dioic acid hydratase in catechol pathway
MCVGRNYQEHVAEGDKVYGWTDGAPPAPIFFTKPPTSVVGPEADVLLHPQTKRLDYEIELGVVIGPGGVNIPEAEALDHVWGYTIVNDVTARDLQDHHKQWFKGKGLDSFCPMGPCLVHRDEIDDPHDLEIELTVNGEVRQKANTRQMIFDIRRIVAELSAGMTLQAGDVIATGTCSGCAFAMEPPAWLKPGDVMEATIERIGTLRNTVRLPPAT